MESGLWALAGVIVGALLNFFIWIAQYRIQKKRDEKQLFALKIEEISQILTEADRIVKKVVSDSIKTMDLVQLWRDKDPWADLNLIKARIITVIYFPHAINAFDEMQTHILNLSKELQAMMRIGASDKSSLNKYYIDFINVRNNFLNVCVDKF